MSPRLLTPAEAAARLRLATKTIQNWARLKKIEHVKLGAAVRIPESAVDDLIKRGTVKPATLWR